MGDRDAFGPRRRSRRELHERDVVQLHARPPSRSDRVEPGLDRAVDRQRRRALNGLRRQARPAKPVRSVECATTRLVGGTSLDTTDARLRASRAQRLHRADQRGARDDRARARGSEDRRRSPRDSAEDRSSWRADDSEAGTRPAIDAPKSAVRNCSSSPTINATTSPRCEPDRTAARRHARATRRGSPHTNAAVRRDRPRTRTRTALRGLRERLRQRSQLVHADVSGLQQRAQRWPELEQAVRNSDLAPALERPATWRMRSQRPCRQSRVLMRTAEPRRARRRAR